MAQKASQRRAVNGAPSRFTRGERRATVAISGILALRMLGLFMILPVFAVAADRYAGHTPTLVGVAIGIYGLTQALLQIPFGTLSDRLGRKPVIVAGLLLFAAGSALAALADSIHQVILGRALQGGGAIAAAAMALTADLTREEQRTKAMAVIGVSIGVAFGLGFVAGPLIHRWVGLPGLFWSTAALALVAIAVLAVSVPTPRTARHGRGSDAAPGQIAGVLHDTGLLRLNFGILCLHLILTASFVVLPLALRDAGLAPDAHWKVYPPVLVLAVAVMTPLLLLAERRRSSKGVLAGAVLVLCATEAGLSGWHGQLPTLVALMVVFFAAFTLLEAMLPSLVTRMAPPDKKGAALGVYSSCQFLGAFLGGLAGGWVHGRFGGTAVFGLCAALAAVWLALAAGMSRPYSYASRLVRVGAVSEAEAERIAERLRAIEGVAEAVVVPEDGLAYLKVDGRRLNEAALRDFAAFER